MRRRFFGFLAVWVLVLGLGVPGIMQWTLVQMGPLDLTPALATSTIALDRHGVLLNAFTMPDGRWRLPVARSGVDPRFLVLLQSYEDRHFSQHSGIDWPALLRAGGQWLAAGHIVSGGSTLAMQVARLIEPRSERSILAKLRQIIRAHQIEARVGRAGVLRLYLQLAPYGGNIEGIRAASLIWFGREPKLLTWGEMALLVALPQSPEARRPDRFPQQALAARNRVLTRAVQQGLIPPAAAAKAMREPVPRHRLPMPNLAPHATAEAHLATPGTLILPMTLDAPLQRALERQAKAAALRISPQISVAIVVVDNATGQIRAHIGAADPSAQSSDGAIDMTRALRSPGSALKPFFYALAFENGIAHPETMLNDRPIRYGTYQPHNFDRGFSGPVTARQALQQSLNLPAIAVLSAVGPMRFLARLRSAGVRVVLPDHTQPGLSIGLGGLGISVMDMARLYTGLARGGAMVALNERRDIPPVPVRSRLTSKLAAYYVTDILRGVPPPVNAPGGRIAYKTGTSYGFRDALAIGYDRDTTIAVWVGRADNGATPGLIGREAAAPILFAAFALLNRQPVYTAAPAGALLVSHAQLPPPLRVLHQAALPGAMAAAQGGVKIAFPPNGAKVDLDIATPDAAPLALKADGGVPPFTWLVNGLPLGTPDLRRNSDWKPDGAGFARISVIDAAGSADSVEIRVN